MPTLKDTLQDIIRDLKLKQSTQDTGAMRLLNKALTKKERLHIRRISFRQGTITIDVDSSAWLYQLSQKKEKLTQQLGVDGIRFRIGEVNKDEKEKKQ